MRPKGHETFKRTDKVLHTAWLFIAAALVPAQHQVAAQSFSQHTVQAAARARITTAQPTAQSSGTSSRQDTVHPIYYPAPDEVINPPHLDCDNISPDALLHEFMLRHSAMDYPAASELALRLAACKPHVPLVHYNVACVLSRLHRTDEALAALRKSIELGWRDVAHIQIDPDLALLRSHESFPLIIADLQQLIAQDRQRDASFMRARANQPELDDEILSRIEALRVQHQIPGMVVALIHDGRCISVQSLGIRDTLSNQPMQPDDRFALRAPSQLLAIFACHRLGLHAHVDQLCQAHLDELENARTAVQGRRASARPVSSRAANRQGATATSRQPTLSTLFQFQLLAIELVTGKTFREYCHHEFLQPLCIGEGAAQSQLASGKAELVPGHSAMGSVIRSAAQQPSLDGQSAERGSLWSLNARDLARLIELSMGSAAGAPDELNAQAATALAAFGHLSDRDSSSAALGQLITQATPGGAVQLIDLHKGAGCVVRWDPLTKRGVIVLHNSVSGHAAAMQIAQLLLGGQPQANSN